MDNFAAWFTRKFLEWQMQQGESKTLTDFAAYLGITQPDASRYKSGRATPKGDNLWRIAQKLGSDTYRAAGKEPPVRDARLMVINDIWDSLTEEIRELLFHNAQKGRASG